MLISEQGPDVLQAVDVVDHASILEAVGGDSRAMAAAQLVFTAQYRSWWVGHEPSWALSSKRGLTQCCHLLPPRPAGCFVKARLCCNGQMVRKFGVRRILTARTANIHRPGAYYCTH